MILGTETRNAAASYLNSTGTVNMLGDKGTGVPYGYNIKWTGAGGTGVWKNVGIGFGNITVTLVTCTWSSDVPDEALPPTLGPAPGVE